MYAPDKGFMPCSVCVAGENPMLDEYMGLIKALAGTGADRLGLGNGELSSIGAAGVVAGRDPVGEVNVKI